MLLHWLNIKQMTLSHPPLIRFTPICPCCYICASPYSGPGKTPVFQGLWWYVLKEQCALLMIGVNMTCTNFNSMYSKCFTWAAISMFHPHTDQGKLFPARSLCNMCTAKWKNQNLSKSVNSQHPACCTADWQLHTEVQSRQGPERRNFVFSLFMCIIFQVSKAHSSKTICTCNNIST